MQLHGLQSWLDSITAQAGAFVNKAENYVINALVKFRDDRGRLNYNISKLKANAPKTDDPQALKDQYAATLAEAEEAKARADYIGSFADQFTAITGLGILPAVIAGLPVAVLLAAVAALAIIITNVSTVIGKYMGARQIADAAKASGKDPGAALDSYYSKQASTGFFGDASQLVWPVAIVLGGYLLLSDRR